ncbi:MAG: hypothetical protein U9M98_02245 [Patescibacteria group bacterium]|nr:hypothetical protein [Patescibacteria group bacterium]
MCSGDELVWRLFEVSDGLALPSEDGELKRLAEIVVCGLPEDEIPDALDYLWNTFGIELNLDDLFACPPDPEEVEWLMDTGIRYSEPVESLKVISGHVP